MKLANCCALDYDIAVVVIVIPHFCATQNVGGRVSYRAEERASRELLAQPDFQATYKHLQPPLLRPPKWLLVGILNSPAYTNARSRKEIAIATRGRQRN